MHVPFKLKIRNGYEVVVEQAEIHHYRKYNDKDLSEKGGVTFASYYIKNDRNQGHIYSATAMCSWVDNFGRKFGRRLAEIRLINNYRKRNGFQPISEEKILKIADLEKSIKYIGYKINKLEKRLDIMNELELDYNLKYLESLYYKLESEEECLEELWN